MHDSASIHRRSRHIFDLFRRRPPHLMFARELDALAMTTEERMQERTKNQERKTTNVLSNTIEFSMMILILGPPVPLGVRPKPEKIAMPTEPSTSS